MPTNQALQVFYGTLPLIVIVAAAWMRESMLLKEFSKRLDDFAARLGRIEGRLDRIEERLTSVERKVDALEIKAWR